MTDAAVKKAAHRLMPLMFDGTDLRGVTPTVHSGDCTKECHTCLLCQFNEAMQATVTVVIAYLRAWEPSKVAKVACYTAEVMNPMFDCDRPGTRIKAAARAEADRLETDVSPPASSRHLSPAR